ncbi:MAG TPA: lamin tail domain-containing protein, partial [Candidatus Dormibacteraeota bacterium]|nr:lamin tail domain-containing protein [Candidatus Dormibacteraeota bacterium]
MDRARRLGYALIGLLLVALGASAATPLGRALDPAAAVSWPVSTDLLLAEVVTGGASASDEWIEITNAGSAPRDLAGLEVVYVTSSGATVTRKATWATSKVIEPGRHLLLANASGVYASLADATYSGGLAATGGALVLRPVGGSPIDAVGWGDATNAFVEGSAAPAPPAGSSIERRPGGAGGNTVDTNDGKADWLLDPAPVPQPLSAPPAPAPSPSVEPSTSPEPSARPEPSPSPDPSPVPTPIAIAAARSLPDDATATVEGVLTAPLGSFDSGRGSFVQDPTGGIALYLDAAAVAPLPAGSLVVVSG